MHELVAEDVQQRYLITYTPTNQAADGMAARIALSTTDRRPGRTRAGLLRAEAAAGPADARVHGDRRDRASWTWRATISQVVEDGVAADVETFQEAVAPVSIVLALDASGSMTRAADEVKAAARVVRRGPAAGGPLGVLLFADTSTFAHDLTTERQGQPRGDRRIRRDGGTALYDALTDALMRLKRTEGRRVVVLLTDGRDENNPGTGPGSVHTRRTCSPRSRDRRGDLSDRSRAARRSRTAGAARRRVRRRRVFPRGRLHPARGLRAGHRGPAATLRCQLYVHESAAQWRVADRRDQGAAPEFTVGSRGGYSAPGQ